MWHPGPPAYQFVKDGDLVGVVTPLNFAQIAEREPRSDGEEYGNGFRLVGEKLVWQEKSFEDRTYSFADVADQVVQKCARLVTRQVKF